MFSENVECSYYVITDWPCWIGTTTKYRKQGDRYLEKSKAKVIESVKLGSHLKDKETQLGEIRSEINDKKAGLRLNSECELKHLIICSYSLAFKGKIIKGNFWHIQIWKSPYMFESIQKSYLENFAFLILINLELFIREVCVFLKN